MFGLTRQQQCLLSFSRRLYSNNFCLIRLNAVKRTQVISSFIQCIITCFPIKGSEWTFISQTVKVHADKELEDWFYHGNEFFFFPFIVSNLCPPVYMAAICYDINSCFIQKAELNPYMLTIKHFTC